MQCLENSNVSFVGVVKRCLICVYKLRTGNHRRCCELTCSFLILYGNGDCRSILRIGKTIFCYACLILCHLISIYSGFVKGNGTKAKFCLCIFRSRLLLLRHIIIHCYRRYVLVVFLWHWRSISVLRGSSDVECERISLLPVTSGNRLRKSCCFRKVYHGRCCRISIYKWKDCLSVCKLYIFTHCFTGCILCPCDLNLRCNRTVTVVLRCKRHLILRLIIGDTIGICIFHLVHIISKGRSNILLVER